MISIPCGHTASPGSENCGMAAVRRFFPGTGPTYDQIVNLCTLGFDRHWKRRIMEKVPRDATWIMDQACGTGILTCKIALKFPYSQVVGVDILDEYILRAKRKAALKGLSNVEFILGRAEEVRVRQSFDCITSSYLAKYADIPSLIRNASTMLRHGGVLVMHDFTYPRNRLVAPAWELYFALLQTLGVLLYPQWKPAFQGLPDFLRQTSWKSDLIGCLEVNGFSDLTAEPLTLGTALLVTGRKE
jgi:demethylmenaquinone methyltransferase / 2-methoxy-6-polyprenyl-1,4-benzoquinol methylase